MGINGVWGYGKSSFLNKFKSEYQKQNSKSIVFWYRVWKNKGVHAVIENFFEELNLALKPYTGELSSEFQGYVDTILKLPPSEISQIASIGKNALLGKETLETHYNSINTIIKRVDRQIIILFDDLDRLESDEILGSLKLMRTLSDFNNIIFIVGYDRKYVVETISKPKENYLDKIFNVEINFLPFDKNLIMQSLFIEIEKAFPQKLDNEDLSFNSSFRALFEKSEMEFPFELNISGILGKTPCTDYNLSYLDFLYTFRDVKRFVNEFKFNVSFLESQLDIIHSEYILLKLLSYKFRHVQELILNKIENILTKARVDYENHEVKIGNAFRHDILIYDDSSKKKVLELLTSAGFEKDFEIINAVLCELFFEKNVDFYKVNQNSIAKLYYIDLYVRNNIAAGNINISQMQKAFDQNQFHKLVHEIGVDPKIDQFIIQNELKYFAFKVVPKNKDEFVDLITALNIFMTFGIHNDDERVLQILKEGLDAFYMENRAAFIKVITEILSVCSIGYIDHLLSDININQKRIAVKEKYPTGILNYKNNFFTNEEIKQILLSKLKSLIDRNFTVSDVIEGYHLLTEKIVGDKQIIRPYEFNEILKKEVEDNLEDYYLSNLFIMISENANHTEGEFVGYKPNDFLSQIFGSRDFYENLISDTDNSNTFEKFKNNGVLNLLEFLKRKLSNFKGNKNNLKKTIKTLEKYIEKGYVALTRKEYNDIWNPKTAS
ncbi:hypothetical protein Musp01_09100 [Muricauda sp. NBRC 101325]|nr:hypothetical protein Musp01_09100 [Muricauda sp. NBRC 101325]